MDYLEGLRGILNEININDEEPNDDGDQNFVDDDSSSEDDSGEDDGDQNFMDDGEGEDDSGGEEPATTEEQPSDEGGEDDGDQNFMDDGEDSGGEEPATEEGESSEKQPSDEGGEDDGDQNFMDGDDSGDGGEGDSEGGEENTEGEESSEESQPEEGEEAYDINKIEDELFSSLTPEQIAIKNHELKNQFIELYSIIGGTLVRINDIAKSNDNVNVLKFITEKLLELREMIDFNIITAYQTRTYIENNIIYQQCIATLNAIAEIINNIPKLDGKVDDDKEIVDKGEPVIQDDESSNSLNISDSSMGDYQEESSDYNTLF